MDVGVGEDREAAYAVARENCVREARNWRGGKRKSYKLTRYGVQTVVVKCLESRGFGDEATQRYVDGVLCEKAVRDHRLARGANYGHYDLPARRIRLRQKCGVDFDA